MKRLLNIATNALRRNNLSTMLHKVFLRFSEARQARQREAIIQWCVGHAEPWDKFPRHLDEAEWARTQDICREIKERVRKKLNGLGLDLSGGGHYSLLHFMTRVLRPKAVIETGVAAGWSSQAILLALEENNNGGRLYSSDFPYFRLKNPEQHIGFVVEERLKCNWTLLIDGDRRNLPRIGTQVDEVKLFHYDSDKSYAGRQFGLACMEPKLASDAVLIWDDIQDNSHFKDLVEERGWPFHVCEFEGKYVGLTGPWLQARE